MKRSTSKARRIFILLVSAAFLAGIAAPAALLIWQATSPSVALFEGPAGTLISTTVDHSVFIDNTFTRINSSTGTAVVRGVFSGLYGSHLKVEQFNKQTQLRLCIVGTRAACAPLAGIWAGPMKPTAAARTAFDFQRYGLTTDRLADWIGLGLLVVLIVGLFGVLASLGCDDDDEDEQTDVEVTP